ncbi:MAG: LytTR family transcriptional regulator DNA-binding domain-containing protein [Flavobacteriaceae bacterium]|nr:LytTR family transcriptional regulator DNA-binding domain-containing protein [Flavobacteriaceae bacterium]
MRIVIGEDEILIAEHLKDIVNSFKHNVVGVGHDKAKILKIIDKTKPDLVLLDIRMKNKHDGIEIAEIVSEKYGIPFIFITAHSNKDILDKALPTKPSGYIIKPFKPIDVYTAIHIATDKFRNNKADNFLLIKENYKQVKVLLYTILFIKSDDNYAEIYTNRTKHIKRISLKTLQDNLEPNGFVRIHRSYIVNLHHVNKVNATMVEVGSYKLPVSRNYLKALKKALKA